MTVDLLDRTPVFKMKSLSEFRRKSCSREMAGLRIRLRGWVCSRSPENLSDDKWADTALQELQERGFRFSERTTQADVLVCLRKSGAVQVGHAPNRALAIARTIRVFADNEMGSARSRFK